MDLERTIAIDDGDGTLTLILKGDPERLKMLAQDIRTVAAAYKMPHQQSIPVSMTQKPCAGCGDA